MKKNLPLVVLLQALHQHRSAYPDHDPIFGGLNRTWLGPGLGRVVFAHSLDCSNAIGRHVGRPPDMAASVALVGSVGRVSPRRNHFYLQSYARIGLAMLLGRVHMLQAALRAMQNHVNWFDLSTYQITCTRICLHLTHLQ